MPGAPQDRLADLLRLQWAGPDLVEIAGRLEQQLAVRVSRRWIEEYPGGWRYNQSRTFGE
jgi:hypothetical protein